MRRQKGARLNSETAGAMIDRRSILSLKIHPMRVQTERTDAYFKVYRQFKMYNDPKLNPAIYGETPRNR